jgi:hypothetical protein
MAFDDLFWGILIFPAFPAQGKTGLVPAGRSGEESLDARIGGRPLIWQDLGFSEVWIFRSRLGGSIPGGLVFR